MSDSFRCSIPLRRQGDFQNLAFVEDLIASKMRLNVRKLEI